MLIPKENQIKTKQCTKCKRVFNATLEFFYKNSGGKYGLTPRCKTCVNGDNKQSLEKRKLIEPEKIKQQNNAKTKKWYHKNIERGRQIARDSAAKARLDPEKYKIIKARKRGGGAGLTPEQIEQIRKNQNNRCAICKLPDPTDLDHCHVTNKVRFLLCKHCNRGLGAFKDSPYLLRRAATLLESTYDNKSTNTSA